MERDLRWIRILLSTIVIIIAVIALKNLKTVFIPLIFALLLTFLFSPMHRFFRKKKLPKSASTLLVIIIIFVLLSGLGTLVYTGLSSFVTQFPKYEIKMIEAFQKTLTYLNIPTTDAKEYLRNEVKWLSLMDRASFTGFVSTTMGTFIDFLLKLILTLIFLIFFLSEKERFLSRLQLALTKAEAAYSLGISDEIEIHVQKYIRYKTLISLATAICGMLVMWAFQIDFIIVGGLLFFILNFIPNIGSVLSSVFPILVYFFDYGFDYKLVIIALCYALINTVWGVYVEPKVMGKEFQISPIVILISLVFFSWLWGPVGMILAIPLISAIHIMIKNVKSLKIITAIMSNK